MGCKCAKNAPGSLWYIAFMLAAKKAPLPLTADLYFHTLHLKDCEAKGGESIFCTSLRKFLSKDSVYHCRIPNATKGLIFGLKQLGLPFSSLETAFPLCRHCVALHQVDACAKSSFFPIHCGENRAISHRWFASSFCPLRLLCLSAAF